jgi:hypothetical protein
VLSCAPVEVRRELRLLCLLERFGPVRHATPVGRYRFAAIQCYLEGKGQQHLGLSSCLTRFSASSMSARSTSSVGLGVSHRRLSMQTFAERAGSSDSSIQAILLPGSIVLGVLQTTMCGSKCSISCASASRLAVATATRGCRASSAAAITSR